MGMVMMGLELRMVMMGLELRMMGVVPAEVRTKRRRIAVGV